LIQNNDVVRINITINLAMTISDVYLTKAVEGNTNLCLEDNNICYGHLMEDRGQLG